VTTADDAAAPFVPWGEFLPAFVAGWEQGDHVSIIGQTKSGKSVLARELVEARTAASAGWHTVVLATKPRDSTLSEYVRRGWTKVKRWPPRRLEQRIILWPLGSDAAALFVDQRATFDAALRTIYRGGRWCVVLDEVRYLSHLLKLAPLLVLLWTQGRSIGITIVSATQRAAWVPLEFYTQARWLVIFRERSPRARRAIAEHCGGADAVQVARMAAALELHHCLVIDQHTGAMLRTTVDLSRRAGVPAQRTASTRTPGTRTR